jgi:predicted RNA binding protein YcfA (HicA-like mRNA interferase family)
MPKYPVVAGREVVAALKRLGFQVRRRRGSHVIMRRGSDGCVVPLHQEVRRGTLGNIVQQAGINPEDLIAALK